MTPEEQDALARRASAGGCPSVLEYAALLEHERAAVIDCLNIYGDELIHRALDDAGLLLKRPSFPSVSLDASPSTSVSSEDTGGMG